MVAIRAHYDGKVIVPDEPVDLPRDQRMIVHIEPVGNAATGQGSSVLDWAVKHPIGDGDLPSDLAHQHDHYLYGTKKKE